MRRTTLVFIGWCAVFATAGSPAQPWQPGAGPETEPSAQGNPGPRITDCRSALRPGWTRCVTPAQQAQAVVHKRRIDAEISAFLGDYGKPPREAVRALLDPTDDNIRAWIRAQQRTLAVAAYVARRMTALQQENPADGTAPGRPNPPSGVRP